MKRRIKNIVDHAEVSEKVIEKYLTDRVKEIGGLCLKYSNANMAGYPDRVILFPGGETIWVELKSKGQRPTKLQLIRHEQLRKLGHGVKVIDCRHGVDELITGWRIEHEL